MKDDSFDLDDISTKHLPLRVVGFVLALAVAVGAFVYGAKKLGGNEAGFTVIPANADGEAPLYAADFRFTYDLEGSGKEIRLLKNEIAGLYSTSLAHLYKLTDAENDYPGYGGNLADLNKRLNRDVTLPQELFDILRDALERTERGEGYSIYAAPLYAEWESIAYAEDAADFDPLHNDGERERLRAIAAHCTDRDSCRLEIVDAEQCTVRLSVSDAYIDFLNDYELPRTVLDLNVMRDAYILRATADALERQGYQNGFLYTTGGMTLSLAGHTDGEYVIYSYVNNSAQIAATVPVAAGTACGAFNAFPTAEDEAGYYSVDGILRCAARPETEEAETPVRSAFVLRRDGDVTAAAYEAFCAFLRGADATEADLLALTNSDGDGKTITITGPEFSAVKPEDGFRAERMTSP